jgi:hypothetical protein
LGGLRRLAAYRAKGILKQSGASAVKGGGVFDYEANDPNWWQRLKDYYTEHRKSLWRFGAALLCYAAIPLNLLISIVACDDSMIGQRLRVVSNSLVNHLLTTPFLSVALFFLGRYFYRSWQRSNQLSAEEAMEADPRPPILYLRPFKADRVRFVTEKIRAQRAMPVRVNTAGGGVLGYLLASLMLVVVNAIRRAWSKSNRGGSMGEVMLIEPLKTLGPVVAVGRPQEHVPPVGAARIYAGDDWQDVVRAILDKAQLVLMFAGSTPGFQWEMTHIFDRQPFIPTLIILPFFQRYSGKQAAQFASHFRSCSGHELQGDLRNIRAIFVPERSQIIPIGESPADKDLNFISPFLSPIAQAIEMNRPGWTEMLVKQARQERLDFEHKYSS